MRVHIEPRPQLLLLRLLSRSCVDKKRGINILTRVSEPEPVFFGYSRSQLQLQFYFIFTYPLNNNK